ncbi:hypothetical protein EMCRGX_G034545 [Ephydatia muelleri]
MGEGLSTTLLAHIAVCMLMASSIDIDHFVAARSLSLKDAQNLQHRPFLHNTTLVLVVTLVLCLAQWVFCSSYYNCPFFAAMFFLSTISHHLRDATRRGTIRSLKTYQLARLLSRTPHSSTTGMVLSA